MKILVSNDDGIDSAGIYELAKSLKEIGEVTVVAPRTEQSAVGHGITMQIPLRIVEFYKGRRIFRIRGRRHSGRLCKNRNQKYNEGAAGFGGFRNKSRLKYGY